MKAGGMSSKSIAGFLADLGSKTPSPGGGAVAALAGASGAALLLMAAEYSDWAGTADDPRARLRDISSGLLELAQEDVEAYSAYSTARTRRKEDPAGYAKALEAIAVPPLGFAEMAVEALGKVPVVLARSPKWFACDVSIAASSLETCAEGGMLLAGINVAGLSGSVKFTLGSRLLSARERLEAVRRSNTPLLLRALPGK